MISKAYLKDLRNTLKQHTKLKNDLQAQKLMSLGLYQQAAEQQRPTTEAIAESKDALKKTIETEGDTTRKALTNPIEDGNSSSTYAPLDFESSNASYALIKTGEVIKRSNGAEYNIYRFNSMSENNIGKWILVSTNEGEYIWDYKLKSDPVVLTEGLKEILFNEARDTSLIDDLDKRNWELLMRHSGLGTRYKETKLYRRLIPLETEGEGIVSVQLVPSDPQELLTELELQLQAHAGGHKGTFNKVNAILKELMKQKLVKSKDYRKLLRSYYHV